MTSLLDIDGTPLVEYAYYNQVNDNNEIIKKNMLYLGIQPTCIEIYHHIFTTRFYLTFKMGEDAKIEFNCIDNIRLQKVQEVIEDYGTDSDNEYISDIDSDIGD
jgi:GTPase SAR1 family protein